MCSFPLHPFFKSPITFLTADTIHHTAPYIPVLEDTDICKQAVFYHLPLVFYKVRTVGYLVEISSPAPVRLLPGLVPVRPPFARRLIRMRCVIWIYLCPVIVPAPSIRTSLLDHQYRQFLQTQSAQVGNILCRLCRYSFRVIWPVILRLLPDSLAETTLY